MNANEKALLIELCRFVAPAKKKIERLIRLGGATPTLLGNLITNGVGGIAYAVLEKTGLIYMTNSEFRESLEKTFTVNEKIITDFTGCLNYVSGLLNDCGLPYAFFGDIYLYKLYPYGCRIPRRIEVLMRKEDLGKISTRLKIAGFKTGFIENGRPRAMSFNVIAKDVAEFGERAGLYKEIRLPYMKYLEVELVFSLKNDQDGEQSTKDILSRSHISCIKNTNIRTLDISDFILYLCGAIHKSACDFESVRSGADMLLYRYTDFYVISSDMTEESAADLIKIAEENNMTASLAYCLNAAAEFFGISNGVFNDFLNSFRRDPNQKQFFDLIKDNIKHKKYRYTESDIIKRFFARSRSGLLLEETRDADE